MYYYQVATASSRYHGSDYLTYHSEQALEPGSIVSIPLRAQTILGIVMSPAKKPQQYATKEISQLSGANRLPSALLDLLSWFRSYYPAPLGIITQQFVPQYLAGAKPQAPKSPPQTGRLKKLPELTAEQAAVLGSIGSSPSTTFLLHGETGSGKTRVYVELAKESLKKGCSVLVLTPEISLTPQLVNTFTDSFPDQTVVAHSSLTTKQRLAAWQSIASNQPIVVIGPRSALFSPLADLGLIIVDEVHETAYKHEQLPYYQALRVASALAKIHDARLILGSATPSVADYYIAASKKIPILRMNKQALSGKKSADRKVRVISLRDKSAFTKHPFISTALIEEITTALKNKEQSLIFINRRGTARLVLCRACGWQSICPKCDIPLVYHGDKHLMLCHTCGYKATAPTLCPVCKSSDIIFKGIGTKSLETSLKNLFPKARIMRFDTDNLKNERLETQYQTILNGQVDILVGTQMLGKGLDLPHLSVVGVVLADASLSFPDYTAEERTYQLLSQVIGRVGRGHRLGNVIIQTYNPDSALLAAAASQNWKTFYAKQLKERETFNFPPFVHLLKLQIARASGLSAEKSATALLERLRKLPLKMEIIGPTPSFKEKRGTKYSWQLVIKSKSRSNLLEVVRQLPADCTYNLDPTDLL